MKIHEFQAKHLLSSYGVQIPRGRVVDNADEAKRAARELGGRVVVKAQIHAGGRGKGGGVQIANDPDRTGQLAQKMLGSPLVTPQTGPNGRLVRQVLVEEALNIVRELYAGMVVDRESGRITLILSSEGGMEIEEVARKNPEKILQVPIHPTTGLRPHQVRSLGFQLSLEKPQVEKAQLLLSGMYQLFVQRDASLVEVNPLVVTSDGDLIALDAKINFDDNALFRQSQNQELRDVHEEEPAELEASQHGLSYIRLDGNIGCMVNGAGLAMATMDIIKLFGGEPANFLDVGGGTDANRVQAAFKILLSDQNVKTVLVNIFGGIVRCDVIAEGMVQAVREVGIQVPLIVRLQGTRVEQGMEIIEKSELDIISVQDMKKAAQEAVDAARRQS